MEGHAFGRNNRRYRIILPCQAWLPDRPSPQVFSGRTCNLGEWAACLDLSPVLICHLTRRTGSYQAPCFFSPCSLRRTSCPWGRGLFRWACRAPHGHRAWRFLPSAHAGPSTAHAISQPAPGTVLTRPNSATLRTAPHGWKGGFRVLFMGDLKPGVHHENAKDRLARLLHVSDGTLGDLLLGGRCVWSGRGWAGRWPNGITEPSRPRVPCAAWRQTSPASWWIRRRQARTGLLRRGSGTNPVPADRRTTGGSVPPQICRGGEDRSAPPGRRTWPAAESRRPADARLQGSSAEHPYRETPAEYCTAEGDGLGGHGSGWRDKRRGPVIARRARLGDVCASFHNDPLKNIIRLLLRLHP